MWNRLYRMEKQDNLSVSFSVDLIYSIKQFSTYCKNKIRSTRMGRKQRTNAKTISWMVPFKVPQ